MEIDRIKEYLTSDNSQERMKAITELRNYDSEVAVPLLLNAIKDEEFLVRSFVAMGLGRKRNSESFAALLELMKFDRDPNVRAEASNSLSFFGQVAAPHLALVFNQDDHWLVRRSILAALLELNCIEELFEVCACGIKGEDLTVREACVEGFAFLAGSVKQKEALEQLLSLLEEDWWRLRVRLAKALGKFDLPEAKEALYKLREDEDHRVVGAALEALV